MSTNQDIKVNLVNVKNVVLKEHSFKMVDHRLPILLIQKHFQVKDLVWQDIEEPLPANDQGLSDMKFANMKSINLTGTAL